MGARGGRAKDGGRRRHSPTPARQALGLAGAYAALTFGISWIAWLCAGLMRVLGGEGSAAWDWAAIFLVLGTLAPMFATYFLHGRLAAAGIAPASFAKTAFGLRPSWRAALVFFALAVWRYLMFSFVFGFPSSPGVAALSFLTGLPVLLLGGGLEEVGWRGFLEPCLTRAFGGACDTSDEGRVSPAGARLLAPLATGLVWGFWHLPLFLVPGTFQQTVPFWSVLLVGVCLSYSFALVRAQTGGVACCILSHMWYNAMLVATPGFTPLAVAAFALEAVISAALLVALKPAEPGRPGSHGTPDRPDNTDSDARGLAGGADAVLGRR